MRSISGICFIAFSLEHQIILKFPSTIVLKKTKKGKTFPWEIRERQIKAIVILSFIYTDALSSPNRWGTLLGYEMHRFINDRTAYGLTRGCYAVMRCTAISLLPGELGALLFICTKRMVYCRCT